MREFRCFYREQLPVPDSQAKAVRYPACEWRGANAVNEDTDAVALQPMNRFVCSWLTSDMAEVSRCDEVLRAIARIETQQLTTWFVDGDAFQVDVKAPEVQFNASHVGPSDTGWWNLPEARFALADVKTLLQAWRDFLMQSPAR